MRCLQAESHINQNYIQIGWQQRGSKRFSESRPACPPGNWSSGCAIAARGALSQTTATTGHGGCPVCWFWELVSPTDMTSTAYDLGLLPCDFRAKSEKIRAAFAILTLCIFFN